MREAKYKKGQLVIYQPSGKEVFILSLNYKRHTIVENSRTTGFEDEFTGSYYCSWLDEKGKEMSDNIDEELLSKLI